MTSLNRLAYVNKIVKLATSLGSDVMPHSWFSPQFLLIECLECNSRTPLNLEPFFVLSGTASKGSGSLSNGSQAGEISAGGNRCGGAAASNRVPKDQTSGH